LRRKSVKIIKFETELSEELKGNAQWVKNLYREIDKTPVIF